MEDEDGAEGFMANNDSGFSRRMMRSSQGRCLGAISDSRREKEKEKENQDIKRGVTNEVASNLSEEVVPAGRPIWPTKIRIPTTSHTGEKAKERKGRKENRNHPMTVAKEKADKTKENPKRSQPRQRIWRSSPPIKTAPSTEPTYAGWTDQDWVPSWN